MLKTRYPSTVQSTSNPSMMMPPARDIVVSLTLVRSVRAAGGTSAYTVPVPSRLRNNRSSGSPVVEPTAVATQPHGWSPTSRSTANGILPPQVASKYQASGGMSYSLTISMPGTQTSSSPSICTIRLMKWYGGPGSRGGRRVSGNPSNIEPNASDGLPQAHEIIAFQ